MTSTWPSGSTRVVGLIGYPARYSLSPALHNAAYKALGVDAIYLVFPVLPQNINKAVEGMRALEIMGLSVTIPHKEAVTALVDELTPKAERLRSVNCIQRDGDRLIGHNTDGLGFVNSLKFDSGFDPKGRNCVVIGAGGAARAVIAALGDAGAEEVAIVNRSPERAEQAVTLAGDAGRIGSLSDVKGADLVVNATPVGMDGGTHANQLPIPIDDINDRHLVVDLIYHPSRTMFLQQSANKGATVANGLGMLIHQAAAQVEIWTGQRPSTEVMRAAVMPGS